MSIIKHKIFNTKNKQHANKKRSSLFEKYTRNNLPIVYSSEITIANTLRLVEMVASGSYKIYILIRSVCIVRHLHPTWKYNRRKSNHPKMWDGIDETENLWAGCIRNRDFSFITWKPCVTLIFHRVISFYAASFSFNYTTQWWVYVCVTHTCIFNVKFLERRT